MEGKHDSLDGHCAEGCPCLIERKRKPIRKHKLVGRNMPAVRVYADGRERCLTNSAGRTEYKSRTVQMAIRQRYVCCFHGLIKECPGSLVGHQLTFDHEGGRSTARGIDDRITLPDNSWQNGACHEFCNSIAGSRRFNYNAAHKVREHAN